jgi:hypothetical protein
MESAEDNIESGTASITNKLDDSTPPTTIWTQQNNHYNGGRKIMSIAPTSWAVDRKQSYMPIKP